MQWNLSVFRHKDDFFTLQREKQWVLVFDSDYYELSFNRSCSEWTWEEGEEENEDKNEEEDEEGIFEGLVMNGG